MGKDTIAVSVKNDEVIRALVGKLQIDLTRLQTAIIKENKHDIGNYLESALNRSGELIERLSQNSSVLPFQ